MTTVQEEFEFQGQKSKIKRGPKTKYIPVYHVELIRDRGIKVAPPTAIQSVTNVAAILRDELAQADREKLICLMLNARHILIGLEVVSVGTLTASLAHPREHSRLQFSRTPRGSSSLTTILRVMRRRATRTFGSRSALPRPAVCWESTCLTT
jgi:hypothetical protein